MTETLWKSEQVRATEALGGVLGPALSRIADAQERIADAQEVIAKPKAAMVLEIERLSLQCSILEGERERWVRNIERVGWKLSAAERSIAAYKGVVTKLKKTFALAPTSPIPPAPRWILRDSVLRAENAALRRQLAAHKGVNTKLIAQIREAGQ